MTLRRILGNLAKSLDSSAIGSYLSKGASETDFRAILYSEISGTPSVVGDSAVATDIVDSAYVQARQGSTTSLTNIDSAASLAILDSDYMQSRITAGGVGFKVYHFETTNGQTTFQDSDADGDVLGYTENGILVFKNGVLLLDSSDYTASDGTSVVLTSGTDSGELVSIAKWSLGGGAGGASISWGGDRVLINGAASGTSAAVQYYNMATVANSSSFGNLTAAPTSVSGACSDATYALFADQNFGIDYFTIATTGNASNFGNQTVTRSYGLDGGSDGTYGLFGGGYDTANTSSARNDIDYVTIASPGNASDFGDLTTARYYLTAFNNDTYCLFVGGTSPNVNIIEYVTFATPGNASDVGDLTQVSVNNAGASDDTYGLCAIGNAYRTDIEYMTISTSGNSSDFGDLTVAKNYVGAAGNGSLVSFAGGYTGSAADSTIDHVTASTPGNATDFADLSPAINQCRSTSGSPS